MEDAVSRVDEGPRERAVAARVVQGVLGAVALLLTILAVAAAQSAPVDFRFSPASPAAGESVTFTSTSSLPRPIVREDWDFDGDGQVDASGRTVTHSFTTPGSYTVTLRVQNDRGRVRSTSKLVTVSPASQPSSGPPPPPPPSAPPPPPSAPPPPASPPPPPPTAPAPVPQPTTSSAAPVPIAPFPVVRIAGSYSTLGVRVRLFSVTAPAGVRIIVRCQGRGCPYRQRGPFVVGAAQTRAAGGSRHVRIQGFRGRLLKPGVRLQVFVVDQDRIGKYTSFRIRRGHAPLRTDSCTRAGEASVVACR
jgi:plastocyanin